MSELRISAMLPGLPPEQANTAPLNSPSRLTSCSRHDRIGPTKSWSVLCQTVAKRVGPAPHASKTMSGSLSPVCGRAPRSLLILTIKATLASNAGSASGRPVNGSTGGGGAAVVVVSSTVVVVAAVVVVGRTVVVVVERGTVTAVVSTVDADVCGELLLHALSNAAPPATAKSPRRDSKLLEPSTAGSEAGRVSSSSFDIVGSLAAFRGS